MHVSGLMLCIYVCVFKSSLPIDDRSPCTILRGLDVPMRIACNSTRPIAIVQVGPAEVFRFSCKSAPVGINFEIIHAVSVLKRSPGDLFIFFRLLGNLCLSYNTCRRTEEVA
ncbi:hypothetical protein NEOLEDRAFT_763034 [Neolentinus lepideus HHB14362 ss-1]|uniref:Secreted protein n=1 Tax=Neolentinus lepideus HHB14362 ss-1 TaxID=1314782 RepID=A0A165PP67_9AGAM|nr:hypothetical protein NEOLEDRAFT_763034 [Neolentinus lepideus HHB14362 ss-1]